MNLPIQIPLSKIKQSINRIDVTYIDRFLTSEQRKRIASFYREEAAKRTHYRLEPEWILPESVCLVKAEQTKQVTTTLNEDTPSSPDTVVTDSDEIEPVDTEILEIGTSPLSSIGSVESPENSPGPDPIQVILSEVLRRNQGSYQGFKKDVITMSKFTKVFGEISNTKLKKLIYQEKLKQVKNLKKQ
ncbi:unnamed protein product [Macrosiphum euphorbiae]|uniref:Uncharacterized protein n=1 Tax=Macrosiphum euphorbiae TaxID=13131 RepID=A0AAV0X354_9HEMI|nr:unnamed protein product [Macrosiphum euphorbiae]